MTPEQFLQLQEVNYSINEWPTDINIGPNEPYDSYIDKPTIGHSFVCRDYVIAKAERLQELGWNPLYLTQINCYTEPVEKPPAPVYHAVLGVEIPGDQTWILDSRFAEPYPLNQPVKPYQWVERLIPGTTRFVPM